MSTDAQGDAVSRERLRDGKYARVERERRFLLAGPPPAASAAGRHELLTWPAEYGLSRGVARLRH